MRVLVTGAAGFAGSGLCRRLLAAGHEVTGLDLIAPEEAKVGRLGPELFVHPRFTYQWGAVQEIAHHWSAWPEVIVHLAAQGDVDLGFGSPERTAAENVLGTIHLLEVARRRAHPPVFLYASSAHAMEQSHDQLRREEESQAFILNEGAPLAPSTPYGFSKAAGEMACWTWYRCYGLPVCVMSNGVVAGPGMRREHFLWKWLTAIYRGEPVILEGGDQTRDLTYVDDVLDAWMLAIEAPRERVVGEKFQVSYGTEASVEDILSMCFAETHRRVPIVRRPSRPGESGMRECFDISKANRVLGYRPMYPPVTTIRLTWAYVVSEMRRLGVPPAADISLPDPAPARSAAPPPAVPAAPLPARP